MSRLQHEVQVKQSLYKPIQGLSVPRAGVTQISMHSAHAGGMAVSPTHQPPLPPENITGTHLCWTLSRP
jgi:hypothetical protein